MESFVWVNLRDNRPRLIEFLFEALKGVHGETIAAFAATEFEKLLSKSLTWHRRSSSDSTVLVGWSCV